MKGIVVPGFKEASDYVKLYSDKLAKLTGFKPFPGTLNLEVEASELDKLPEGRYIRPEGKYGGARVIACSVFGIQSAIVIPDKTRHENVVEVIAPISLRDAFELKDGDEVGLDV